MREIKFRAWNINEKKMYYATFGIGCFHSNGSWWAIEDSSESYKASSVYNDKLMQYTGLKDKNGVEIYEGDIVRVPAGFGGDNWYKEYVAEVEWQIDSFCVQCHGHYQDEWQWSNVEVIGNIHENSNLLTNESEAK